MELTIIIPVYNVEEYIIECLDSVLKQDIDINKYEILCIDDKGTDSSIKLVKNYILKNDTKNITIIEHEKNIGLSAARNTGILNAKGKYILFVDSDDTIYNNTLSELINVVNNNNLDILEFNINEISQTSVNISSNISKRKNTDAMKGIEYFKYACKKNEYYPMACCRMYNSEFLKKRYFV